MPPLRCLLTAMTSIGTDSPMTCTRKSGSFPAVSCAGSIPSRKSCIAAALSASGKIGFPIPHCIAHPAQNSTYCSHRMYMKSAFCLPVLSSARFRNCFLQHCFGEVLEAARQHPIRNTGSGQHLSHKDQSKRAGHICVLLLFSLIVSDWSAALPVRRMLPASPRTPGCGRASSRCWPAHET